MSGALMLGEWSVSIDQSETPDVTLTLARGEERRVLLLYIGRDGYPRVGIFDEQTENKVYTVRLNAEIAVKHG